MHTLCIRIFIFSLNRNQIREKENGEREEEPFYIKEKLLEYYLILFLVSSFTLNFHLVTAIDLIATSKITSLHLYNVPVICDTYLHRASDYMLSC